MLIAAISVCSAWAAAVCFFVGRAIGRSRLARVYGGRCPGCGTPFAAVREGVLIKGIDWDWDDKKSRR